MTPRNRLYLLHDQSAIPFFRYKSVVQIPSDTDVGEDSDGEVLPGDSLSGTYRNWLKGIVDTDKNNISKKNKKKM